MSDLMLIGSRALQYWYPAEPVVKDSSDLDILARPGASLPVTDLHVERHDTKHLNNAEIFEYGGSGEFITIDGHRIEVCNPNVLCLIKRSHLHRPHKFARNMWLYQQFSDALREATAENVTSGRDNFLNRRIRLTKKAYGDRVPSLNQSNEDFFDDAVEKHFVHDDLHIEMAHFDEPLYEKMKVDKSLAKCEKSLWDGFSREQKLKCVLEECYVIGLERFVIPSKIKGERHMPCKFAAIKALDKVCTTLCSGWFRDFAIDHYVELIELVDGDHMNNFFNSELWTNREVTSV